MTTHDLDLDLEALATPRRRLSAADLEQLAREATAPPDDDLEALSTAGGLSPAESAALAGDTDAEEQDG